MPDLSAVAGAHAPGRRSRYVLATLVGAVAFAACTEDYEGGAACPALCPEQNVIVFDTTFDPVALDTTVTGFPTVGTEVQLLLARVGDSVDIRPVIRFDSLPQFYNSGGTDTIIQNINNPYLKLRIDRLASRVTQAVTFELFDVDSVVGDSTEIANDTTTARERLLFRPDRRIGMITLDTADIGDSIRIPIDSLALINKILNVERLRVGIRATSDEPVQLRIYAYEGGDPPIIRFEPAPEFDEITVQPRSVVPRQQVTIAADLTDYVHVIDFPPVPQNSDLVVGGVPGRRTYIRFDIPSRILDSSNVLRATLELVQRPVASVSDTSPLTVFPLVVTAGTSVTDIARSAFLTNVPGAGFDSVRFAPGDSGRREIEIVNALRAWSIPIATGVQRAVVLRAGPEGMDPRFIAFFSSSAPADLRPRLRVSYSPVRSFGVP